MSGSEERLGRFRSDLQVLAIDKAGARAFRVVDPRRGLSHELWEIEQTVASLLDGVRSADEVAAACAARGFAVSAAHVRSFHRELKGMGFVVVDDSAVAAAADHKSDAQRFIDEAQLYMAAGRYELAEGLFEAALQIDDSDIDADIGLARCRKMLAASAPTMPPQTSPFPFAPPAAPPTGGTPGAPSTTTTTTTTTMTTTKPDAFAGFEVDFGEAPPAPPALDPPPQLTTATTATTATTLTALPEPAPKRRSIAAVVVTGAIVVALAALGVWRAFFFDDGTVPDPETPAPVVVTTGGTPGAPSTTPTPPAPAPDPAPSTTTPTPAPPAPSTVKATATSVAHPKTPVPAPAAGKFSKVFVAPGGRVLAGQRLLTLVGKTAVVVVAPVAGTFTAAVPLGKVMKKGDVVGHVANASAWQLTAHLDAPPAGRNCRVVIVGNDAPCAVVSVDPDLVVSVDAAAAPWLSASTVGIEIELSP